MEFLNKSVGITGHQPFLLGGYDDAAANKLKQFAYNWLNKNKPKEVVSGLAAGWDTAVADAAVMAKIPLISALAYKGQADHWPEDARSKQDQLIKNSEYVYIHADEKEHGCYSKRDHWVLERSDVILALWSGVDGGTARAIAKASKMEKLVINLWNKWEDFT